MKLTPFIKPIRLQGGTFYTCSSAGEDLQLSLAESKNKFRFSKFALLKLPELKRWDVTNEALANGTGYKNYMQLNAIPGAFSYYAGATGSNRWTTNNAFAESFQNYFFNLETMLTANSDYKINEKRTVSERVFFKWLKETGAIRFREAVIGKEVAGKPGKSSATGIRYVEEDETIGLDGKYNYERVVKYIGNINVNNAVKHTANSYTEVSIHIPTSHGSTKDVLFSSIEDDNYHAGMILKNNPTDKRNRPYLYGRTYNDVNTLGPENKAFYDSNESFSYAASSVDLTCWKFIGDKWYNSSDDEFSWWYSYADAYTYRLEEKSLANCENDLFAIGQNPNDDKEIDNVKFYRSRLDGISVDFNPTSYHKISGNLTSLGDYNASGYSESFSFNTVLLYYDVYSVDNPNDCVTNLFGVLFLDNIDEASTDEGRIECLTKYKPNKILKQNGNSYAFNINIKFDVSAQDADTETTINDYNTYSLELYSKALSEMRKNSDLLLQHISTYNDLETKVDELRSLVDNGVTFTNLKSELNELKEKFENANSIFASNDALLKMIERTNDEINAIYTNKTSIKLAYNIDVILPGSGISVEKNGEYLKINNTKQCFNIGPKPLVSLVNDSASSNSESLQYSYVMKLREFDNYMRITDSSIENTGGPFAPDRDICIYVDDSDIKWKAGQRFRISFSNGLDLDNSRGTYTFHVCTDSSDMLHSGYKYSKKAATITAGSFNEHNNKPIIEIICVDEKKLEFAVDIF